MKEALLALGVMLALLLSSWALRVLSLSALFRASWWLIAAGLVVGVPFGLAYHIALFRALRHAEIEMRGWLWNPTRFHHRIPQHARLGIQVPFTLGALGAALCLVGCLGLLAAALQLRSAS